MSKNQAGVSGEHHIGGTRVRRDDVDGRLTSQDIVKVVPLFGSKRGAGRCCLPSKD